MIGIGITSMSCGDGLPMGQGLETGWGRGHCSGAGAIGNVTRRVAPDSQDVYGRWGTGAGSGWA